MAKALSLVAHKDLESQVEALERDGYVYFPGVLDADEIAELRATMDRLEAIPASHDRDETLENGDTFLHKLISNSFNRDPLYLQFLDRSPVIEVVEAAHGEDCHCIGMHSWLTGPGRPDQGLHTDWLPISLPADVRSDPHVKIPIFITTAHYILTICMKRWDRRSLCRAVISLGAPRTGQQNGIIGGKRVSCARQGMWCFSAAKSGIVVPPIPVTKSVTSCRCTMPCG